MRSPAPRQLCLPPVIDRCRRWNAGQPRWVPTGPVIDPLEFGVELLTNHVATAKPFCMQHHYSGSYPAARLAVGLYRKTGVDPAALVGIAVFAEPTQPASLSAYLDASSGTGCELARLAILDCVAGNGESWFLRRAIAILRDTLPAMRGFVSYADPSHSGPRLAHFGVIYQASSAVFVGRSKPRTVTLTPDSQIISERGLSKVRNEERSRDYVIRQLLAAGARPRHPHESWRDWVDAVIHAPPFRRQRVPGKFIYTFGVDRSTRRALTELHAGGLPYPKPARLTTAPVQAAMATDMA